MSEVFQIDLDEELLSHLADPDSFAEIWGEHIDEDFIVDESVKEIFRWQFEHRREHGKPATASVLAEEFDLDLAEPLTVVGDLIERLRDRYMRNNGRSYMEKLADAYKEDPFRLVEVMPKVARELVEKVAPRGEAYGTGDFDRAMHRYDSLVLRGPGPSFGFKAVDGHFGGMHGLNFGIAPPKTYKALALDTPIPTPDGWTTMGALEIGDTVYDQNGQPCKVVGKSPVWKGRPCYRITFSDRTSIVADAEHLWETSCRGRGVAIRTTQEIANTLKRSDQGSNHSICVAKPIECLRAELPIDPYVLGAWLGDGTAREATITTADYEIIETIKEAGYEVSKWPSAEFVYGIRGLIGDLRALNLLQNKHIPSMYLRAHRDQRLALLRGLLDTDGHCSKRGEIVFVTTSPHILDGILELIRSLGFKPTANEYRAMIDDRDCGPKWHVRFGGYADQRVFGLDRKQSRLRAVPARSMRSQTRQIVDVTPISAVPVQCISVDSPRNLYLAGEGMIPTHNSWIYGGKLTAENVLAGTNGHLYSLELPAEETDMRIRCLVAGVPYWKYLRGSINNEDRKLLAEASEFLDDSGTYRSVKPQPGHRTFEEMVERAGDAGAEFVVIDQLQYVETRNGKQLGGCDPREFWQPLNAARDLSDHMPIMCIHQFNRSVMNADKMPEMQQAKGAAAIEETATLALGLWANKDMRKSNLVELGTLASRNYTYEAWEIGIELSKSCDFELLGRANHDDD